MLTVSDLVARTRQRPRKAGRSSLYRWMMTNHGELKTAFADDGPDWQTLCEEFAKAGLTDRTGKPASPATARQTWMRVKRDADRIAAGTYSPRKSAKPHPSVRMIEPAAAPEPPPSTPSQPSTGNAAEKIRAFRESLGDRKVRIPEPINPAKRKPDGST